MVKVYKDDVGTEIILDCEDDITNATEFNILVKKPNGELVTWVGELKAGTTTKISYFLKEGDIDLKGKYLLQANPNLDSWVGRGETTSLTVYDHYK